MANSFLLLESGSYLLLEDGTSKLILDEGLTNPGAYTVASRGKLWRRIVRIFLGCIGL